MVVEPDVQFKPIKGNTLLAHPNLSDKRTYLGIERVLVYSEIAWCILQPDHARLQNQIFARG